MIEGVEGMIHGHYPPLALADECVRPFKILIEGLNEPVLLVGPCAVEEVGETLIERLGQNKVHQSKECNDLAAIVEAMCHLMEVSPSRLDPGLDPIQAATVYQQAIENGTRARMIDGSCDVHKLR